MFFLSSRTALAQNSYRCFCGYVHTNIVAIRIMMQDISSLFPTVAQGVVDSNTRKNYCKYTL